MSAEPPTLGELEAQVLRVIWDRQPCTERHVYDELQSRRDLARTTVLKTIQRLEAKGLLERVAGPGPTQFRAAVERTQFLPSLVARFVSDMLGGSAEPLVAYLAGEKRLSPADLSKLRSIARKLDRPGESE